MLKDLENSISQGELTPPIFANSFHDATPQAHTYFKAGMPTSDPEIELTRCEKKEGRREISFDVANTDQLYDDVGLTLKAARMIWEDAHFEVLSPRAYAQVDASAQLHCCVVSGVISHLVKRSSASFARYVLSTEIDRHDFFDAFIDKVMTTMHEASSTSTRHWRLAPLTYKQYVRLHYRYGQFMHKMQPPFMRLVAHAAQDMRDLDELLPTPHFRRRNLATESNVAGTRLKGQEESRTQDPLPAMGTPNDAKGDVTKHLRLTVTAAKTSEQGAATPLQQRTHRQKDKRNDLVSRRSPRTARGRKRANFDSGSK